MRAYMWAARQSPAGCQRGPFFERRGLIRIEQGAARAARGRAGPPENATKRCDFYWVNPGLAEGDREGAPKARLERVQAQRLHEAGAAGARAQRGHGGERVAHDDAQAELAPIIACDDDAGHPRRVRAQPPAVGEAEQGVGEGEAGDVRGDRVASSSSAGVASGAMPT